MMQKLEPVRQMERELKRMQRKVSRSLRPARKARNLTLQQVADQVKLTAPAIYNLETGKSWSTPTVTKIAKLYDKIAA